MSQVWGQVDSQVEGQVRSQVRNEVLSQVWSQVESQNLIYFYESYYGRADDLSWISYYDFFERIGIIKHQEFNKLKGLFKCGIFTSIIQKDICYISRPPVFLKRDDKGRMHCINDYAVFFKDSFGLHYIHGVYFEPNLFNKKDTLNIKQILSLKNIEQRQALLSIQKPERLFDELNPELIDKSKRGNELYSTTKLNNEMTKFLKYKCPSTGREYVSFVPKEIREADEGMAWKYQISKETYSKLRIET